MKTKRKKSDTLVQVPESALVTLVIAKLKGSRPNVTILKKTAQKHATCDFFTTLVS